MEFKNEYVSGKANINFNTQTVYLQGMVPNFAKYAKVAIIAARPPDRMTSYAGSGLPFPCSQVAFDNSPNNTLVDKSGTFNIIFKYPNSYYAPDMLTKIPPAVYFVFYKSQTEESFASRIDLYDNLPVRSLVYRANFYKGPGFYSAKEPLIGIRSAEDTMRMLAKYKSLYDIA